LSRILVLMSVALLGLLVTVPFDWKDQALFGLLTVVLAIWLDRRTGRYTVTLVLVFLSVFSTARYAYWRVFETYRHLAANGFADLQWDVVFVLLLLGAEAYAIVILLLGHFQSLKPLSRNPTPLPREVEEWPNVDVFIPTYNEPLDIVRPTVLAAMNMDWPQDRMRIYILDDGRRDEFRVFAEECGAGYMTRPDNKHAKAGNINHALTLTSAEYVAIFDCDHIPTRSFLQMTMGWFGQDPKMAMMQTPHYFYTPDPFEKNLGVFRQVPNEGSLFYGVIQDCNDFWNATFFCGSCAVIRRTCIEEIGGIAVETVTEDAHTALRMQRRGYNTGYIRFPQAAGLATASLADHIGQRIRWARGMVQILRTDFPLLGRGLKMEQRFCYLNSTLHYLYAVPRLIFLTAPLVYLLLNRSNVYGYVGTILAYAFPHLALATVTNSRIQGRFRYSFWNEVYETVLAPYILLPTLAALVSPKHGKFNVTPKSHGSEHSYFAWKVALPFMILLALNTIGILLGALRLTTEPERQGPLLMNMVWATVNMLILGASIAVAAEKRQRRAEARLERRYASRLILEDGTVWNGETVDLSNSGAAMSLTVPFDQERGHSAMLLISPPDEEIALPVTIAGGSGDTVRLTFRDLSIAQREGLTRIIFGAADSWLTGHNAAEQDRPMRSFWMIFKISMRGLMLVPRAIFARSETPEPALDRVVPQRRTTLPAMLLALGLGAAMATQVQGAQPVAAPAAPVAAVSESSGSRSFSEARDFRNLGQRQPILLRGAEARAAMSFSLPVTKVATQARLGLNYQLSPVLEPNNSVIQVVLNGSPLGAVPLERAIGGGTAFNHLQIDLPAELLVAENTITFELTGRCAGGCANADGEVRTLIDLTSTLSVSGEIIPLPNDLAQMPTPFFDAMAQQPVEIGFVMPADADLRTLQAAGVLASYFGAMADHRGVRFQAVRDGFPHGNAIVFALAGTAELIQLQMPSVNGPVVAIRENPSDAAGKLLVIAGLDTNHLLMAARAFALQQAPLRGDLSPVNNLQMPAPRVPYDAPRWMNLERIIRLGDGTPAEQLRVAGTGTVRWYFRLPPDLYFGQRESVPLRLNYRYAQLPAGARAEVRVRINGVQIGTRRFERNGNIDTFRDTLEIPVAALYPRNTLSVEFNYIDDSGRPQTQSGGQPLGIVLRDSELDLRRVPHFARLPRLDLFAKSGFPFTRLADLSETAVVLPSRPAPEELTAYLEMMGFFGAQTGMPALRVEVIDGQRALTAQNRDLLVIGSPQSQPLFASWSSQAQVHVGRGELVLNRAASPWVRLRALPLTPSWSERKRLKEFISGEASPGIVIQAFVSPLNPGRSVVAISGPTPQAFESFVDLLDRSTRNDEVYGVVSVQSGGRFVSFSYGREDYVLGVLGWRDALDYWIVRYLWLVPIVVLLLAWLLARHTARWAEWRAGARLRMEI